MLVLEGAPEFRTHTFRRRDRLMATVLKSALHCHRGSKSRNDCEWADGKIYEDRDKSQDPTRTDICEEAVRRAAANGGASAANEKPGEKGRSGGLNKSVRVCEWAGETAWQRRVESPRDISSEGRTALTQSG